MCLRLIPNASGNYFDAPVDTPFDIAHNLSDILGPIFGGARQGDCMAKFSWGEPDIPSNCQTNVPINDSMNYLDGWNELFRWLE